MMKCAPQGQQRTVKQLDGPVWLCQWCVLPGTLIYQNWGKSKAHGVLNIQQGSPSLLECCDWQKGTSIILEIKRGDGNIWEEPHLKNSLKYICIWKLSHYDSVKMWKIFPSWQSSHSTNSLDHIVSFHKIGTHCLLTCSVAWPSRLDTCHWISGQIWLLPVLCALLCI